MNYYMFSLYVCIIEWLMEYFLMQDMYFSCNAPQKWYAHPSTWIYTSKQDATVMRCTWIHHMFMYVSKQGFFGNTQCGNCIVGLYTYVYIHKRELWHTHTCIPAESFVQSTSLRYLRGQVCSQCPAPFAAPPAAVTQEVSAHIRVYVHTQHIDVGPYHNIQTSTH